MNPKEIKEEYAPYLMSRMNVVGVGIDENNHISVLVESKVKESELPKRHIIPSALCGTRTDVVEIGDVRAFTGVYVDRYNPTPPGVSIGHKHVSAGTFGCLVRRGLEIYILSNNHVLANCNNCKVGDDILQPGAYDGGNYVLAELAEFIPIEFNTSIASCFIADGIAGIMNGLARTCGSTHRLEVCNETESRNLVDAAIAKPISPNDVIAEIKDIGVPIGSGYPVIGSMVQKTGRTTGYKRGKVTQTDTIIRVKYGMGRVATFHDQVVCENIGAPGDSGSLILDMDKRGVGLLFAGSDSATIFSPLPTVLALLNVDVLT